METYSDREDEFLKELTILSRKYGVVIGGCTNKLCGCSMLCYEPKDKTGTYYLRQNSFYWDSELDDLTKCKGGC